MSAPSNRKQEEKMEYNIQAVLILKQFENDSQRRVQSVDREEQTKTVNIESTGGINMNFKYK